MSLEDGKVEVNGIVYPIVTLDFETFYGDNYTLSGKMNTSEYIRDDRFHIHGVAIKHGAGKTLWYTGRNIAIALREIDWPRVAINAHNAAFDGFILSEVYDHVPAFYLDTLSMSRGTRGAATKHNLDAVAKAFGHAGKVKAAALVNTKNKQTLTTPEIQSLGAYAVDDVNDTYKIFWDMYPNMPDDELRLVDMTMRMFCVPVLRVDMARVRAELDDELGSKKAALINSGATVEDLMSNTRFAAMLHEAGATIPMKTSPSTGKPAYAFAKTDMDFQHLAKAGNSDVQALCSARLKIKSTIGETRAVRFLEAGKDGGKLPVLLNYCGAHTTRWSGGNKMNLQNLLRGGELRRSILAPEGHRIVVADSAQIEARVLAWVAGQADIVGAFAAKKDVYKLMASGIYGVPIEAVTPPQRFVGKVCVLGLGYGMGAQRLQRTLQQGAMGPPVDISEEECYRIVQIYRQRNWKIVGFWRTMDKIITNMTLGIEGTEGPISYGKGFILLPNGLFLQYPGMQGTAEIRRDDLVMVETTYLTRNGRAKLYGGLLTENVTQALARVIIGEQMLKIDDAGERIVTMSHDEIVSVTPENRADAALASMISIMSTAPDWALGLPLAAEGGHDVCYSK